MQQETMKGVNILSIIIWFQETHKNIMVELFKSRPRQILKNWENILVDTKSEKNIKNIPWKGKIEMFYCLLRRI